MPSAILTTTNAAWPWSTAGTATTLTIEGLGGGGGGGGEEGNPGAGGGGKGGSYAKVVITKGAETTLNITVGTAGTAGSGGNGGSGGFSRIVQDGVTRLEAPGGVGGTGATTNSHNGTGATTVNGTATGTTTFAGGNGGNGSSTTPYSGGGGGAAGPSSVGGNASNNTAGSVGTGTWADGDTTRHKIGAAGNTAAGAGTAGANYGAGGAGGLALAAQNRLGGAGGAGIVVLTWVEPAALVGTATVSITATLTRSFNDERQALINGIDSAQSEAAGWDAIKASIPVTAVVRTSSTVVTITLPALASYDITATETLTATIPASAVTTGSPIVATPTLTIAPGAAGAAALVGTASLTVTASSALAVYAFNDYRQSIINGIDSAQSEANGWDVRKADIPVTAVVRTSDTVVTITLPAISAYDITATETLTATIPAGALTGGVALVATPTLTITSGVAAEVPARLPTFPRVAVHRSFSW